MDQNRPHTLYQPLNTLNKDCLHDRSSELGEYIYSGKECNISLIYVISVLMFMDYNGFDVQSR